MERNLFDEALAFVLEREGGYSDHPADLGGPTNRGITQKTYNLWRLDAGQSPQSVQEITESEIQRIYRTFYWEPAGCVALPDRVSLVQFDCAVNLGVKQAVKILQSLLPSLEVGDIDGYWGPTTQKALAGVDVAPLARRMIEARRQFYRDLVARKPSQGVFLRGWMARCNLLESNIA